MYEKIRDTIHKVEYSLTSGGILLCSQPLFLCEVDDMASNAPDTSQEKLPRYRDHGGYLVAGGFPVEGFSSALSYQAQDNDLFIVTYPKVSLMKKC